MNRQAVIRQWTGHPAALRTYPRQHGRWPDRDAPGLLQELCQGKVCDVGCGTGRCAEAFHDKDYIGVDINPAALAIAKREWPKHEFQLLQWDDLYPPADTYLFYTLLLHIPDGEIEHIAKRTTNGNGKSVRVVVFESMDRSLRNPNNGVFHRDVTEYIELFRALGKRVVYYRQFTSRCHPYFRQFLVMEES